MSDLRKFLLLFVSILFFFSCQEEKKSSNLVYVGPKSELTGIDMVFSDSAKSVVRMVTEKQITLYSEDRVYPKEMKLWFFDKLGNVSTQIRGDSARFFRQKNHYKLMGHVKIFNIKKSETLTTDEFTWVPDEKRIFTEKPVQIRTNTEVFNGVGLDAAQDFSTYSLRRVTNSMLNVESLPN
ncbi:LPS export ABC transporter periplasmic protein LptC [Aquirufa sp. ROCK-SH2]